MSVNELYLIKNIQFGMYLVVPFVRDPKHVPEVNLSAKFLKQDNFKFYKADKREAWATCHLLGAVSLVAAGLEVLRGLVARQCKEISLAEESYLLMMQEALSLLFVFSKDIRALTQRHKKSINPPLNDLTANQRRLKEVGLLDLLPPIILLADYFVFQGERSQPQPVPSRTIKQILERGDILAAEGVPKTPREIRNLVLGLVRLSFKVLKNMCLENI